MTGKTGTTKRKEKRPDEQDGAVKSARLTMLDDMGFGVPDAITIAPAPPQAIPLATRHQYNDDSTSWTPMLDDMGFGVPDAITIAPAPPPPKPYP